MYDLTSDNFRSSNLILHLTLYYLATTKQFQPVHHDYNEHTYISIIFLYKMKITCVHKTTSFAVLKRVFQKILLSSIMNNSE